MTIETIIVAALTIGVGLWVTPAEIYGFLGDIITVAIIVMYSLANVALYFYMRREHRENFNIWRHGIVPLVGTLLAAPGALGDVPPRSAVSVQPRSLHRDRLAVKHWPSSRTKGFSLRKSSPPQKAKILNS